MFVKWIFPIFLLFSLVGFVQSGFFSNCWAWEFECGDKKCIDLVKTCDGVADCEDGSDELKCDNSDKTTESATTVAQTRTTREVSTGTFSVGLGSPAQNITVTPDSKLVVRCRDEDIGTDGLNWYKPGGELPVGSFVEDGRLVIPRIRCEDGGPYICYHVGRVIQSRDFAIFYLEVDQNYCSKVTQSVKFSLMPTSSPTWMMHTSPRTTYTTPKAQSVPQGYSSLPPNKPYVYRVPCENGSHCYQFCCNGTCVTVPTIPSNTFRCDDGSYVPSSSICNRVTDCPDGSDERGCTFDCQRNEFKCGDGACIPEMQRCDGNVDCIDGTDESNCKGSLPPKLTHPPGGGMEIDCAEPDKQVKGGHVLQLECKFFGRPLPEVKWKKNEGHIPSKCTSNSKFGHGILVCPNFQQSDQGAYSCVGENSLGSAESQPKTVIKCKQITCENGFRVRDEHNVESCLKCFCSGRTTSCSNIPSKMITSKFAFPRTEVDMYANVEGEIFIPNSSNVNWDSLKKVKYCLMPEDQVQGHGFLMSYGRNLNLPAVNKKIAFIPNAPDVIITGKGVTLTYSLNRISQNSSRMNIRFWNDNWLHRDRRHASRSDIMGVLAHLEQLFIRCEYEEGKVKVDPFATVILESAVVSKETDSVSYVEKCSCPIGYDGLSCEKCAPGYERNQFSDKCEKQRIIEPMKCPPGAIGKLCDQCDVKNLYYMHNKKKKCVKTTCNDKGSIGLFPDERDECICKERVTGPDCDTCDVGYFHLEKSNPYGCKKCWCSGVSENCESSNFRRATISSSISAWGGFNESSGGNFWLLPPDFSGNLLTSYGGFIRYTLKYQSNVEKQPKPLTVEILGGNGVDLKYVNTDRDVSLFDTEKTFSVPIEEPFWKDAADRVVTRDKLMFLLTQVKAIFVESPYHLSSEKVKIIGVELDVAEDTSNDILSPKDNEKALKVEICECPVGYEGTSCESCSVGYYRQRNGLEGYVCAKCECDIKYCDPLRGCAVCPKGKYNNNTDASGSPVCLDCPCHGNEESCMKDDYGLVMCFCKPGYYGTKCEIGESTEGDFQVSIFPIVVLNKKVGTFVTFNCSYKSEKEHRIEFQKKYTGNPPPHNGLFKVENYGWCSTLETNIERDMESVDCIVRSLEGEVVARITAKVIGTGADLSKPEITNCYDEPKYVTENEDVYLQCDATGSPEPKVTWYKTGNMVEVNTTDGVHTIPSVNLSMNGTSFTCVARNSEGDARCTTRLIVRKRCVLSIQPVNPEVVEGESIEFICSTASGSTVAWSRTDAPLPERAEVSGGTLFFPNVTMGHMGEYKCIANDPYGPSVKTTRLTVKKRRIPPKAMIIEPDMEITAGESVTIHCEVTGDPQPKIIWTKIGEMFIPGNVRVSLDGRELQITNAELKSSGFYQCRAESFLNATSRILINVVEMPEIMVRPEEVQAKVGDTVEIDCIPIKGEPLTSLEWSRRSYYFSDPEVIYSRGKLRFKNIQTDHDDTYYCTATNAAGRAQESVRVMVGRPARVSLRPNGTMDVVPRDQVDLVCEAEGDPPPEIKWLKYMKIDRAGNRFHKNVEVLGSKRTLTVAITQDLDSIVCEGKNSLGVSNATLVFNVKSEQPVIHGLGKRVRIGSRVELDFSALGGKINCTRQKGSMIGDECYIKKGLEITNLQVQHTGTYKCWSEMGEMSYTVKVDGFVNRFTKHGMSYLILPITVKSQQEFQVEISFKAERQSGFLLVKKKHHAFSMYLKRGKLTVRLRRHSEEITLTTKQSLQLSVWHTAVFKLRNSVELTVYDEQGVVREIVTDPAKFEMNWSVNVEDNLYVGGVKISERHLPLSPVDAHFEGCISRLIIDQHEYKMTEEGKWSQNVSLCNVCTSGGNPCGSDSACYDAPTEHGFVCVCGKGGCRENCKGRGCQTKFSMCDLVKPCGHPDNKCLPNGNGLKCQCASGFSGLTCDQEEAFEFSLNGDGFVKLPETYLPRNSLREPEVITIAFSPGREYVGQRVTLLSQGVSNDYLEIYLEDDNVVYVYKNQNKKLQVSGPIDLSNEYLVEVTRRNNTATMVINGDSYADEAPFSTNRVFGDIYIGGLPDQNGFSGCIHEVTIAGRRINTLAKDVVRRNIQRSCKGEKFLATTDDSASINDDSANDSE